MGKTTLIAILLLTGMSPLRADPAGQADYLKYLHKVDYQLCGGDRYLRYDPQYSCCCHNSTTGKYCIRSGLAGHPLDCNNLCQFPCM
jgi:hypothetical protein